ncbi:MAG TPA: hypothetical protein VGA22_05820 [Gemmatimonadales bacterium]|jgi:hypothetical protein
MTRGSRSAVAIALVSLLAHGCDLGPPAGEIVFTLDGPQPVAAVQFRVVAGEPETIDTVTAACTNCAVYMVRNGDREVRGVLVGDLSAGEALSVLVSNREAVDLYTATVAGVALADFTLIASAGFTLTGPPPVSQ